MKVLIIRFSSIGDVCQALSLPGFIKISAPQAEIHFVTRKDFADLTKNNPSIAKTWTYDKNLGLRGLFSLIGHLRRQKFTHIYDAHNNLRSFIIRQIIWNPITLVRPMHRIKRFLLLRFHINLFEMPFSGQRDLIKPLEKWNFKFQIPPVPQIFIDEPSITEAQNLLKDLNFNNKLNNKLAKYYVLVPSAAYALKRWPLEYWQQLIELNPEKYFVILAGANDIFTESLNKNKNVHNLTGKTTLWQSAAVLKMAAAVISNDTGLLHIAEQIGIPAIALMGPAPFGFPSRPTTIILERNLKCRPCSKHGQGPCVNPYFQECLKSILPAEVSKRLNQL